MLRVVADDKTNAEMGSGLDELVREGARRMLAAALEAEVDAYVSASAGEVDEAGRRLVVRNGHAQAREIVKEEAITSSRRVRMRCGHSMSTSFRLKATNGETTSSSAMLCLPTLRPAPRTQI